MSEYPAMTDSAAWTDRFKAKYRTWPLWTLYVSSLFLFIPAMVYWAAQHFEAMQDVIAEHWDSEQQGKEE